MGSYTSLKHLPHLQGSECYLGGREVGICQKIKIGHRVNQRITYRRAPPSAGYNRHVDIFGWSIWKVLKWLHYPSSHSKHEPSAMHVTNVYACIYAVMYAYRFETRLQCAHEMLFKKEPLLQKEALNKAVCNSVTTWTVCLAADAGLLFLLFNIEIILLRLVCIHMVCSLVICCSCT